MTLVFLGSYPNFGSSGETLHCSRSRFSPEVLLELGILAKDGRDAPNLGWLSWNGGRRGEGIEDAMDKEDVEAGRAGLGVEVLPEEGGGEVGVGMGGRRLIATFSEGES